jgi:hypothetical protein
MDRHMLRHVKLQSLDIAEQRDSVRADILEDAPPPAPALGRHCGGRIGSWRHEIFHLDVQFCMYYRHRGISPGAWASASAGKAACGAGEHLLRLDCSPRSLSPMSLVVWSF